LSHFKPADFHSERGRGSLIWGTGERRKKEGQQRPLCEADFLHRETRRRSRVIQGFPMLVGFNIVLWGWALAMQGQPEEGLAQIHGNF